MSTESSPKFSAGQKLDIILLYLFNNQKFFGNPVSVNELFDSDKAIELGITNTEELIYLLDNIVEMEFAQIHRKRNVVIGGKVYGVQPSVLKLSLKANEYCMDLVKGGNTSNRCFVAMRFTGNYKAKFIAIKQACDKFMYDAFIVEDMPDKPLETINDKIIAGIKMSKFIVADLTDHSNGVYFEAGYALGRDMKVILSCEGEHFKQAHFDINHYPVIVYSDLNDLTEKLGDKIAAYIEK